MEQTIRLPNLVSHGDLVGVLRLGTKIEVGPKGQDTDEELGAEVGQAIVQGLEGVVVADGGGDLVEDGAGVHTLVHEHGRGAGDGIAV